MTFPRHKSRSITVRGAPYRWAVGRVDRGFVQRVHIEHALTPVRPLVFTFRDRYRHGDEPITPHLVRVFIEHALDRGWRPTEEGPAFVVDPAPEDARLSLESWTSLDPIRCELPWEHDTETFSVFRVWAGTSDRQMGTLVADIACDREAVPGSSRADVLRCLLPQDDEDGDELTFYIRGGRVLRRGSSVLMRHGCCTTLDEWVEWRDLLETGHGPWNGHDPMSSAVRVNDRIRFIGSVEDIEIDIPEYERLVGRLAQDMSGFLRRVEEWLAGHAPPDLRAPILAIFARTLHLPCPGGRGAAASRDGP